jgi:hypothetical protein
MNGAVLPRLSLGYDMAVGALSRKDPQLTLFNKITTLDFECTQTPNWVIKPTSILSQLATCERHISSRIAMPTATAAAEAIVIAAGHFRCSVKATGQKYPFVIGK